MLPQTRCISPTIVLETTSFQKFIPNHIETASSNVSPLLTWLCWISKTIDQSCYICSTVWFSNNNLLDLSQSSFHGIHFSGSTLLSLSEALMVAGAVIVLSLTWVFMGKHFFGLNHISQTIFCPQAWPKDQYCDNLQLYTSNYSPAMQMTPTSLSFLHKDLMDSDRNKHGRCSCCKVLALVACCYLIIFNYCIERLYTFDH